MSDGVYLYNLIIYSMLFFVERELMYIINIFVIVLKEEEW